MSFFQNPFHSEFLGSWVLGDRQASLTFKCPAHAGRGQESVTTPIRGPYSLSSNDADGNATSELRIAFSFADFKQWNLLPITITGSSMSAVTPLEVLSSLQAITLFNDYFTAVLEKFEDGTPKLTIRQKKDCSKFRFYIINGRAESVLLFNKFAGVSELPTYFDKHTVANSPTYVEGQSCLIRLGTTGVDAAIINNAVDEKGVSKGFSSSTVLADYQLLRGRSGIFVHHKYTVDGSNRITVDIEYPAGALAGDLVKKTTYSYTSSNTNPDKKAEVPYILQTADIVTP
jgi:hypothetical protein